MLRVDYNQLMTQLRQVAKGNARLTQSDLILIRLINPKTTNYRFPVLENEIENLVPEEVRLNINDLFAITHMGVFLGARQYIKETDIQIGSLQLYPYVPMELNPEMWQMKRLYSGYMKIDANNVTYIDKWNLRKHEFVPQTQFQNYQAGVLSMPPNPDFTAQLQAPHQPSIDYKSDGIFPVCPNIVLSGAKKNNIQIFLPDAIAPDTALWTVNDTQKLASSFGYIVVWLRGYLGQNCAAFQK